MISLTSCALLMNWNHFFFDSVSFVNMVRSGCEKYPLKCEGRLRAPVIFDSDGVIE